MACRGPPCSGTVLRHARQWVGEVFRAFTVFVSDFYLLWLKVIFMGLACKWIVCVWASPIMRPRADIGWFIYFLNNTWFCSTTCWTIHYPTLFMIHFYEQPFELRLMSLPWLKTTLFQSAGSSGMDQNVKADSEQQWGSDLITLTSKWWGNMLPQ